LFPLHLLLSLTVFSKRLTVFSKRLKYRYKYRLMLGLEPGLGLR
jgi:hypothetical protein